MSECFGRSCDVRHNSRLIHMLCMPHTAPKYEFKWLDTHELAKGTCLADYSLSAFSWLLKGSTRARAGGSPAHRLAAAGTRPLQSLKLTHWPAEHVARTQNQEVGEREHKSTAEKGKLVLRLPAWLCAHHAAGMPGRVYDHRSGRRHRQHLEVDGEQLRLQVAERQARQVFKGDLRGRAA